MNYKGIQLLQNLQQLPQTERPIRSNSTILTSLFLLVIVSNPNEAQQFRIWATGILKEYMRKGFALDDERLKNLGGGGYFKELLERIRDIRASEKCVLSSGSGNLCNQHRL